MTEHERFSEIPMRPIGFVRSPHSSREDVPRGLGATHLAEGGIELGRVLADGLRDVEGFSHLFVLWVFHRSEGYELIKKNPTDGLEHGVFATRSPHRPNPIGLTVVELLRREGHLLHVHGVDMLDGTPVLDVKPYLSSVPAEKLRRGWLEEAERRASRLRAAR